ncbi:MAG: aminoacyl-tRNA hydrolase, partial [Nitrospirota bacterium]
MWLIVGLGNPGKVYSKTRHNLGFMVIDALASKSSIKIKNKSKNSVSGKGNINCIEVILLKPLTFMNKSGIAVKAACKKYQNIENLLIVHDDLDLKPGIIRIKKNGSAGGHRGIESVSDYMGTKDFTRLKIGIGRPAYRAGRPDKISAEDYVLSPFSRQEKTIMKKSVEKAADAIT